MKAGRTQTLCLRNRFMWFLLASFCAGCAAPVSFSTASRPTSLSIPVGMPEIQKVGYQAESIPSPSTTPTAPLGTPCGLPFEGTAELSVDLLVQQVLARNPSLAQMEAAWEATRARYPQVTSLDDPMLAVTLGPATYSAQSVNPAYRISVEQKYPFPGKRRLRGQQAAAEANAAGNEVDDMRLQLVESARSAFYEYYMVHRAVTVNEEGLRFLERFHRDLNTRYEQGLVPQRDILQAKVEVGRQRERLLNLEQTRQIASARINTLVNLPPDAPLPPPPRELRLEDGLPDAAALREQALARRPDLQALANRLAADQAALALANKEFYPDFTPFIMYDRFMGNTPAS